MLSSPKPETESEAHARSFNLVKLCRIVAESPHSTFGLDVVDEQPFSGSPYAEHNVCTLTKVAMAGVW